MEVDAPMLSSADIEELKARYSDPEFDWTHDRLVPNVFETLGALLLNDSGVRDLFTVPNTFGGAEKFWIQLNEEVRNDLRACVDAAIKDGAWNALIAHSTYFYRSRSHEYDLLSQAHYGQVQDADFRISSKRDGAANLPPQTERHS
jgi:hypothetical protein